MNASTDLIYETKRKMLAKYPRFGSEIATSNFEYRDNLKYHTAATDGKNVYFDPNFFASLSEDDRLFVMAHEVLHNKFMHMFRLMDKNGEMRDLDTWNTATDAIINANLERDGFKIREGAVNMPEALNYTAEEFYQILLEKKQNEQNEQNEQKNGRDNENSEQDEGNGQGDDHSLWEEAFEQQNSQEKEKKANQGKETIGQEQGRGQDQEQRQEPDQGQTDVDFDEKAEFEKNRKEKREKFKSRREKTEKDIRSAHDETIKLENIGKSKEDIDWKVLIRREVEKAETIWSQRRSIAENNYAYRLEENDIEDEAETEIMIDVSGSVELELVKVFLRQIKPLLRQSKLKVGCFNEKFWGFVDIKSVRDIDNFSIPQDARGISAWTTDLDLAARSFTKKREINKIVFTDGFPSTGMMPKEDLKGENVIWLVYGNEDFNPCCGKVINITEKQLEQLQQIAKKNSKEDISR